MLKTKTDDDLMESLHLEVSVSVDVLLVRRNTVHVPKAAELEEEIHKVTIRNCLYSCSGRSQSEHKDVPIAGEFENQLQLQKMGKISKLQASSQEPEKVLSDRELEDIFYY